MSTPNVPMLLNIDDLPEKYVITEKLGEGSHSEIYGGYINETNEEIAIKLEKENPDGDHLVKEVEILQELQASTANVCHYYDSYETMNHKKNEATTVLIMSKMGKCISSFIHNIRDRLFSKPLSVIAICTDMLQCLHGMHSKGYIHQDIKPSNFVNSLTPELSKVPQNSLFYDQEKRTRCYIIDFGLAEKVSEKREETNGKGPFMGTSMYASLASHRGNLLGKKDDLYSWMYCFISLLRGYLPWFIDASPKFKNRHMVRVLKEYYTLKRPQYLTQGLVGAKHLEDILKYLNSLKREDEPSYEFLMYKVNLIKKEAKEVMETNGNSMEEEIEYGNQQMEEQVTKLRGEMLATKKSMEENWNDRMALEKIVKALVEKGEYFIPSNEVFKDAEEYFEFQMQVYDVEYMLKTPKTNVEKRRVPTVGEKRKGKADEYQSKKRIKIMENLWYTDIKVREIIYKAERMKKKKQSLMEYNNRKMEEIVQMYEVKRSEPDPSMENGNAVPPETGTEPLQEKEAIVDFGYHLPRMDSRSGSRSRSIENRLRGRDEYVRRSPLNRRDEIVRRSPSGRREVISRRSRSPPRRRQEYTKRSPFVRREEYTRRSPFSRRGEMQRHSRTPPPHRRQHSHYEHRRWEENGKRPRS